MHWRRLPVKSGFDQKVEQIIERNLVRPESQEKADINFLLMWLAHYKGLAEGYRSAIDHIKDFTQRATQSHE